MKKQLNVISDPLKVLLNSMAVLLEGDGGQGGSDPVKTPIQPETICDKASARTLAPSHDRHG